MAGGEGSKNGHDRRGTEAGRRQPRRRTILNLGIPFVPVDDAVNQAEDAIATGFDVLQKVVEEIQAGYEIAKDYNKQQREAEEARGPRPPLPWVKVVERGKKLQDVTLEAMKKGNDILLDSTRSGMSAAMSFVEMLANARTDVDQKLPRLAGPVFDSLTVKAAPGQPIEESWSIQNRGLARLRIHVQAEPLHYLERAAEAGTHEEAHEVQPARVVRRGKTKVPPLYVKEVRFEPQDKNKEISVLTVLIDPIPRKQPPGTYEGSITAENFDLFIGQLRVEVPKTAYSPPNGSRKTHASPRARGRTRTR
jgi:hypothetical protein